MTDMICVAFQFGEAPYILNDALCLTQAQWDALTPEEVAAMQQMRFSNWVAAITAPPSDVVDEPVVDEPVDAVDEPLE